MEKISIKMATLLWYRKTSKIEPLFDDWMDSCLFLSKIAHLAELITKLEASIVKVAINKKLSTKKLV